MKIKKKIPLIDQASKLGFWGGKFGGNYVPETLKKPIEDLEVLFNKLKNDKNVQLAKDSFLVNLYKINKRLGASNFSKIKKKIQEAFSNNNKNIHYEWIEELIVNYYDKMYDYQLGKKIDRCTFKGHRSDCLKFLKT